MSFWPPPSANSSTPPSSMSPQEQFSHELEHDAYQQAVFAAAQSGSGQFDPAAFEWQQRYQHSPEQHLVDPRTMSLDPLPIRSNDHSAHVHAPVSLEDEIFEARMLQEALRDCDLLPSDSAKYDQRQPAFSNNSFPQHSPSFQSQQVQFPPQFATSMITPTNMIAGSSMAYRNPSIHAVSPVENLRNVHVQQLSPSSMSSSSSSTRSPVTRLSQTGAVAPGTTVPGGNKKRVQTARICQIEGCTRGIRSRGLCKAHGGGRRCTTPGCTTSDQGGGHCVLHGGGRRCRVEGCMKSAQWRGVCKLHGGARRCRYGHCTKNGQVKQGYCRLHYNLLTQQQLQLKFHPGQNNPENGSEGDESKEDLVQTFSP